MKTVELEGAMLDFWAARAHGMVIMEHPVGRGRPLTKFWGYKPGPDTHPGPRIAVDRFRPSTDWGQGGPIIEREKIAMVASGGEWDAYHAGDYNGADGEVGSWTGFSRGETPLIAAMRAYVLSKYGEEVPG